jgi:hypothetical protein
MNVRMWTLNLLVGGALALTGAPTALASCPGGQEYAYEQGGSATCPSSPGAARPEQPNPPQEGVAGVVDLVPAGPLAAAVIAPPALGPRYGVVEEWIGGDVFYGILAAPLRQAGEAGLVSAPSADGAVLQTVQRLPSEEAAAQFFPVVVAAPPSDVPVVAHVPMPIGTEGLRVSTGHADDLRAAVRMLAAPGEMAAAHGLVAVARKDAYIVTVEIRAPGDAAAPAGPSLDDLLQAMLARLPG